MTAENETVQLEFTLKSGAVVTVEVVDDWVLSKGPVVMELSWRDPENAKRRLIRMDLEQVAAIVEVRP